MKGTVKWFNAEKGFGFITTEGRKRRVRTLFSNRKEGFKTLEENQEVEFEVVEGEKGLQAEKITIL